MKREGGRAREGRWMGRRSRGRWFTTSCSLSRRTYDGKHSRNPECLLRGVCLPQIMCKCETWGLAGVEASLTVSQGRNLVTHSWRPLSFSRWKHKLSQGNCWVLKSLWPHGSAICYQGKRSLSDTNTVNYGTTLPARAWGRCDLMIPSASWRLLWYLTLWTWSAALFHVRVTVTVH